MSTATEGERICIPTRHYDSQQSKEEFKTFHWKGPYKVMKVLSVSNYISAK